jgi:hypothetical protein
VEAAEAGAESEGKIERSGSMSSVNTTTIAMAWQAFLSAIEEAKELNASGASSTVVADLLQHARELLDIIDDEISLNGLEIPGEARDGLAQMRTHLATVERCLVTTH